MQVFVENDVKAKGVDKGLPFRKASNIRPLV